MDLGGLAPWMDQGPIPCTVGLDGASRVVSLDADLPAYGSIAAGKLAIRVSAYGQKLAIPAKPSPTADAPNLVYQAP